MNTNELCGHLERRIERARPTYRRDMPLCNQAMRMAQRELKLAMKHLRTADKWENVAVIRYCRYIK